MSKFAKQFVDAVMGGIPGMEKTWTGRRRWNPAKAAGQVVIGGAVMGAQFIGKAVGVAITAEIDKLRGKNVQVQEAPVQRQQTVRQETIREVRPETVQGVRRATASRTTTTIETDAGIADAS